MNPPLVSVIIPAYNSKHFLRDTVQSALDQTYQFLEIILVDDGSTDGTETLFANFESQGVQCYRVYNGGASHARNHGLSKAKGDYIQFLDADDILEPTKIEKQLTMMLTEEADVCYVPWVNFKYNIDDAQTEFRFAHLNHDIHRTGKELMISYGMDNWFILTVSWLVKRSLIDIAGKWDVNIIANNDGEYFSRILFWSEKVVCCNEILAYYRRLPSNSLSKLNSKRKIETIFQSFQKTEALLSTANDVMLLTYPKRLYYMQYKRVKKKYPKLAKRAAKNFDRIIAPSFLTKKKIYWKFITIFGLYRGTKFYNMLQPFWKLIYRK